MLLRDCFSQTDLHIAPITMPTESDVQAIRIVITVIIVSYCNLTLLAALQRAHATAVWIGEMRRRPRVEGRNAPDYRCDAASFKMVLESVRCRREY
jgi:hypothetical protein